MENIFQCYRTISQNKKGSSIEIVVHGRALKKIKIGDNLFMQDGNYFFNCNVVSIIAYEKEMDEVFPPMGCSLTLNANDYLDNSVEFLNAKD